MSMLSRTKQASSLVLVVMIMAASSIVILAGSSAFISAARQRAALESSNDAKNMAENALREGQLRLSDPAGRLATGEYGVAASATGLISSPRQRMFRSVDGASVLTPCSQLVTDADTSPATAMWQQLSKGDANCPSYKLAIRKTVESKDYGVNAADVQLGVEVAFVNPNSSYQLVKGSDMDTVSLRVYHTAVGTLPRGPYDTITLSAGNASPTISSGATTTFMIESVISSSSVTLTPETEVVRFKTTGSNPFKIDKGFTTIDATGIAADGSEYRLLNIIRPANFIQPGGSAVMQTGQIFAKDGLCYPNNNACR